MTQRQSYKLVDRKAIPKRWKTEAHARESGRCYVCRSVLPLTGPTVDYDHRTPLWLDDRAHRVENIFPICKDPCHRNKTKSEAPVRAKVLRLMKAKAGDRTASKRPLQSRGFDKSKTKRFDGSVVERALRPNVRASMRDEGLVRDSDNSSIRTALASREGA